MIREIVASISDSAKKLLDKIFLKGNKANPIILPEIIVTPTPMNLLHSEKIKDNKEMFIQKVNEYSLQLDIKPDWLMQVMNKETGGTFSPSIKNMAGSGAVGLIQFMPSTAEELGTSTSALAAMSNVQQLYYVYKYLKRYKGKMKSFGDTYLAVFYPAAIGKPDDYELPAYITKQNKALDLNKNGRISKAEIVKWAGGGYF